MVKAKLGQNFLADPSVLQFEAESADVRGKSVLEIGAGDGRLTEKLLSEGAGHITAIEIDHKLAKQLRMKFSARPNSRVRVLEQDFLEFEQDKKYNVITGNIPYYITSPILFKLAKMDFDRAIICMQKEVALRMLSMPGTREYGRLSVSTQLLFSAKMLAIVDKAAFEPRPMVDSCIVAITKTGRTLSDKEEHAIGAIFSHRKKSVKNAVIDARRELFGSQDKPASAAVAQTLKYAGRKVFTLAPSEALEIAQQLVRHGI